MLSIDYGGMASLMLNGSWAILTMMSLVRLASWLLFPSRYVLFSLLSPFSFYLAFLHVMIFKYGGGPVDPPRLPWAAYTYGPDGFAWEHLVRRNPNVMGYPFP